MGPVDPRFAHLLRGTGALPTPPGNPAMPAMRPGNIMQPTTPYQQGAVPQIAQTVTEFITGYQQNQEAERQKNMQDFMKDIELMKLGIKPDFQKTAEKMKKAGLNVDIETPVAPPPQAMGMGMAGQPAPPQQGNPMEQQRAMPSAALAPPVTQMQAPAPPPANPQQAPTSLWGRIKQGLGVGPELQADPNSAPVQALQQMAQRYQTQLQRQDEIGGLQHESQMAQLAAAKDQSILLKGILNGVPKAMEMGTKMGIVKTTPYEDFARVFVEDMGGTRKEAAAQWIAVATGMPQMRTQMLQMADKLRDNFGGDLGQAKQYVQDIMSTGQSKLKPTMTMDEKLKVVEQTNKYQDIYPTLPRNVAALMANNDVIGNKDVSEKIQQLLSTKDEKTGWYAFPTKGQLEQYNKQQQLTNEQTRIKQTWAGLALQKEGQEDAMQRHFDNAQLALFSNLRSQSNTELDNALRLAAKATTAEAQKSAMQMAEDAMHKMKPFTFTNLKDRDGKPYTFDPTKVTVDEIRTHMFDIGDPNGGYTLRMLKDAQATGGENKPEVTSEFGKYMEAVAASLPALPSAMPMVPPMVVPPLGMGGNFSASPAYPHQYTVPTPKFVNRTQKRPGGY